jgi:hypothetical protein
MSTCNLVVVYHIIYLFEHSTFEASHTVENLTDTEAVALLREFWRAFTVPVRAYYVKNPFTSSAVTSADFVFPVDEDN